MQIRKRFRFEAAHLLPFHPGKCARLHGHSYRLEVALEGSLQTGGPARGMIEDFDAIAGIVEREVVDVLDHSDLNVTIPNPTAEEIALWIFHRLKAHLAGLHEVVLWETATACAVVRAGDPWPAGGARE